MGRKKVCSCINFRNRVDARSGKTGARASFFGSEGGPRPRRGRAGGTDRGYSSAGGPEGNGRFGPEVPKGRILVNGPGGGTGRLPGVPGCDILELRIWYKNRSTAAGLALPDVGAERILFF